MIFTVHAMPAAEEIEHLLRKALQVVPKETFMGNPDCGLKTQWYSRNKESLIRLVEAAKAAREKL